MVRKSKLTLDSLRFSGSAKSSPSSGHKLIAAGLSSFIKVLRPASAAAAFESSEAWQWPSLCYLSSFHFFDISWLDTLCRAAMRVELSCFAKALRLASISSLSAWRMAPKRPQTLQDFVNLRAHSRKLLSFDVPCHDAWVLKNSLRSFNIASGMIGLLPAVSIYYLSYLHSQTTSVHH